MIISGVNDHAFSTMPSCSARRPLHSATTAIAVSTSPVTMAIHASSHRAS